MCGSSVAAVQTSHLHNADGQGSIYLLLLHAASLSMQLVVSVAGPYKMNDGNAFACCVGELLVDCSLVAWYLPLKREVCHKLVLRKEDKLSHSYSYQVRKAGPQGSAVNS